MDALIPKPLYNHRGRASIQLLYNILSWSKMLHKYLGSQKNVL